MLRHSRCITDTRRCSMSPSISIEASSGMLMSELLLYSIPFMSVNNILLFSSVLLWLPQMYHISSLSRRHSSTKTHMFSCTSLAPLPYLQAKPLSYLYFILNIIIVIRYLDCCGSGVYTPCFLRAKSSHRYHIRAITWHCCLQLVNLIAQGVCNFVLAFQFSRLIIYTVVRTYIGFVR